MMKCACRLHVSGCRVSRLYVKDACIDERNNELGLNTVKQVSCDQTDDVDTTTCESVFKSGKLCPLITFVQRCVKSTKIERLQL